MTKNLKNLQLRKKFNKFFVSKTTIYLSIKNVQVTGEDFSSKKRPSNTSKKELVGHFALLDPDPDSESGS
jgi:hypothetical protein